MAWLDASRMLRTDSVFVERRMRPSSGPNWAPSVLLHRFLNMDVENKWSVDWMVVAGHNRCYDANFAARRQVPRFTRLLVFVAACSPRI